MLTTEPATWVIDENDSTDVIAYFDVFAAPVPPALWPSFTRTEHKQTITTITKHKSGMDYATAVSARDSYLASNPGQSAKVSRQNSVGMYSVNVSEVVVGAWEVVE